jgi:hypothetical protein
LIKEARRQFSIFFLWLQSAQICPPLKHYKASKKNQQNKIMNIICIPSDRILPAQWDFSFRFAGIQDDNAIYG